MRKFKIPVLLITLGVLIATTYWLVNKSSLTPASHQKPLETFAISENALPDKIVLDKGDEENILLKKSGVWYFNDSLTADPTLAEAIVQILKKVRVKRNASKSEKNLMVSDWISVTVLEDENQLTSFQLLGDKEKQITYFRKENEEEIHVMEIPGYSTYIADIFYYEDQQWRSRNLFVSTWRSLQALNFQYPGKNDENFHVLYEGNFFRIPEIEAFDTARLINYFDDFSLIKIDEFLMEDAVGNDRLNLGAPDLILEIKDADTTISGELKFYIDTPLTDRIVVKTKEWRGIISKEEFQQIARTKSYFRKD